jgi:hypothetical protein
MSRPDNVHHATKHVTCCACLGRIEPGETYVTDSFNYENKRNICLQCDVFIQTHGLSGTDWKQGEIGELRKGEVE